MSNHLYLNDLGIVNALGAGKDRIWNAVSAGDASGLKSYDVGGTMFHIGKAQGSAGLKEIPHPYANRVNRLLQTAAEEIAETVAALAERFGPHRIAVLVGSTDNGSEESRIALAEFMTKGAFDGRYGLVQQEAQLAADFVAWYLGTRNINLAVSTACTSSATAMAEARNLIELGVCDAAVVGGADIVSQAVLFGFHALEAVDPDRCQPFSKNRKGINLGEGAALFVLSREDVNGHGIQLLGCGESSDSHHMTAPEPEGTGAAAAMRMALHEAALEPADVDYVNLHGTGTPLNDSMEAKAMHNVFGKTVPSSSTKSLVGHTLGAAGAMEIGFCWLALSSWNRDNSLPVQLWDGAGDDSAPGLDISGPGRRLEKLEVCMSNSYAFGGSNVSVVIGKDLRV